MKIIKQGKLPEVKTYVETCSNCGTVFEFNESECIKEYHRNDLYLYTNCPLCLNSITIESN